MKKIVSISIIIAIAICSIAAFSFAADMVIEKRIDQIVFKNDKNGSPYARIIVQSTANLNGVTYNKAASVMAFGDLVADVKTLKKGQTLKAIVSEQNFRGATSYQLLKVLK